MTSTPQSTSFFSKVQQPFPSPVHGKINTAQFLAASKSVVDLVDQCGKVFAPVKYDMNGNIQKILAKYEEDKLKFEFINDMILFEQREGRNVATEGLMWLRRALQFIHSFFSSILEDQRQNKKSEDLSENVKTAYRETLEMYHGWMAKQLFNLLSRMVPSRSQILKALSLDEDIKEDLIFQDMEYFLGNINLNLNALLSFYTENKLESDAKCK